LNINAITKAYANKYHNWSLNWFNFAAFFKTRIKEITNHKSFLSIFKYFIANNGRILVFKESTQGGIIVIAETNNFNNRMALVFFQSASFENDDYSTEVINKKHSSNHYPLCIKNSSSSICYP